MDSHLLYAMRMVDGKEIASGGARLETGVTIKDGMTRVDIRMPVTDAALAMVKNLGGHMIRSFAFAKSIEADFPINQIEKLAADARVIFVSRPSEPLTDRKDSPDADPTTLVPPEVRRFLESSPTGGKPPLAQRLASAKVKITAAMTTMRTCQSGPAPGDIVIPGIRAAIAEGDICHRARAVHTTFDVDGTGLRIGIISDSFKLLNVAANDITSGDLQGAGNPNDFLTPVQFAGSGDLPDSSIGNDEGGAMAQLLHSVAPGAQLFFATAFNSIPDSANNILALRGILPSPGPFGNVPNGGCDIIVDDGFFAFESGLHDGQLSSVICTFNIAFLMQVVNDVTARGCLYFSSATNSGILKDNQSGAWEGDFTSAGPPPDRWPAQDWR